MGKKDGNRKRKAEEYESENEQEDAELQAELAALQAARNEKLAASGAVQPEKTVAYNKEGLLKCVEELDRNLPFAETLLVTGFSATIVNENDDIEREVGATRLIIHRDSRFFSTYVCLPHPRWRSTTKL